MKRKVEWKAKSMAGKDEHREPGECRAKSFKEYGGASEGADGGRSQRIKSGDAPIHFRYRYRHLRFNIG